MNATIWSKVPPELRPKACFFGDGKERDPNLPSDATRRQMELAMKDLMHRTSIKSTNDKKRDALIQETISTVTRIFPFEPSATNGLRVRSDLFPKPDHDIINCFSIAAAERVNQENKKNEIVIPAQASKSKKSRPSHLPPVQPKQQSKIAANISWSQDQKRLIDEVTAYLNKVQEWRNNGSRKAELPKGPLILVLGGPGVGKTTVLSRITELCVEYNLPLLCAAMTGIIIIIHSFHA
jgi:flagellar biosynthesis GTPase FlhF